MKKLFHFSALSILLGALAPLWTCHAQTNFFVDTFNRGSSVDSLTQASPTTNSASYEAISSKIWYPPPSMSSHDLEFGISNTSGGMDEIQALFATNPVALNVDGTDYIQLTIVFTNTSGGLLSSGQGYLGIGLYNTQGATNYPVPGGLNNAEANSGASATNATGNCQLWEGYAAEVAYEGANQGDLIMTRPQQTSSPTGNNAQDLVTKGSGSQSYSYPAGVVIGGAAAPSDPSLVLATGGTYTDVYTILLNTNGNLAITNALYSGPTTNGTPLAQYGAIAAGSTNVTTGFNGFAFGFYQKTAGTSNVLDVSSIIISGQSSPAAGPPTVTTEPSAVLVTTNGSCAFSVVAQGNNLTYQWQRNGTNLVNGGNISGATSDMLVISPATTNDQLSQANGYSVIVSQGIYSTNSITNSLTLIPSTELIWNDNSSDVWDINNSVNWQDTNGNQLVFNFGDPVVFNDIGFGGPVELDNSYLSAASLTMAAVNFPYTFVSASTGGFAGPGSLLYTGPAKFTIDNVNTYTGGTLISNVTAYLLLQNLAGLGSGPLTLSAGTLEMVPGGSASSGIQGNVDVAGNFTVLVDATNNSYAGVFLGDLSGASGQTLTLTNGTTTPGGLYRVRVYGNNTTYNANLNLANSNILFAPYSSANSQSYNGVISGPGALMEKGTITYLNGPNTYSGGTTPAQGGIGLGISSSGSPGALSYGPLGTGPLWLAPDSTTSLTGSGEIFASNAPVTIGNAIQYPSGTNNLTLVVGGSANLTLSGPYTLQGNDGLTTNTITFRNIEVTNTALTTISGVISDGGSNYGFNVSGTGVLALNNTETYGGPTTVTNATLLVNGQIGSGAVTIATNATLGGNGTINGPVAILNGGTLTPGNQAIGTLTINNSLTCASGSTNSVAVNESSHTEDLVVASSVTYGGTLIATNLSGTLSAGNSFVIYNATSHSGNFNAVAGTPGSGLAWSFNPTNGTLSVIASVATNPTNITYTVSGGSQHLSWPANHLGWYLQVQTNSVSHGIGTNWVTVPNSSAVDSTNIPIVLTNGTVFYRLMYP